MANPVVVEVTRGQLVENRHRAAAVICDSTGAIVESWGDVDTAILPRSSIKMIQALPLIESGAAQAAALTPQQLALACASHQGAEIHTDLILAWLKSIGMNADDLLCGPQPPRDATVKGKDRTATRLLNNCSGKHTGFLTLAKHLAAETNGYLDPDQPVQKTVAEAFAEVTETPQPLKFGIDGCSAPNFAAPMANIACAMAKFAVPDVFGGARGEAAVRLIDAMKTHPILFSGEGRACFALTTATEGRAVVKTGADGVFTGICLEKGFGFCLKIDDGNVPACETLCAALLVRVGALDINHPTAQHYLSTKITNWNGEIVGERAITL